MAIETIGVETTKTLLLLFARLPAVETFRVSDTHILLKSPQEQLIAALKTVLYGMVGVVSCQ